MFATEIRRRDAGLVRRGKKEKEDGGKQGKEVGVSERARYCRTRWPREKDRRGAGEIRKVGEGGRSGSGQNKR